MFTARCVEYAARVIVNRQQEQRRYRPPGVAPERRAPVSPISDPTRRDNAGATMPNSRIAQMLIIDHRSNIQMRPVARKRQQEAHTIDVSEIEHQMRRHAQQPQSKTPATKRSSACGKAAQSTATLASAITGAPTSEWVMLRCQCSHVGRPQKAPMTSISGAFAASTRIAVPYGVARLNPARARNSPTSECVRLSKL